MEKIRVGEKIKVKESAPGFHRGKEGKVVAVVGHHRPIYEVRLTDGWIGFFERHEIEKI